MPLEYVIKQVSKSPQCVSFNGCSVRGKYNHLISFIHQHSEVIETLELGNMDLNSLQLSEWRALLDALNNCVNLYGVSFNDNQLTSHMLERLFAHELWSKLTSIGLYGNCFDERVFETFIDAAKQQEKLKDIAIEKNPLEYQCHAWLASSDKMLHKKADRVLSLCEDFQWHLYPADTEYVDDNEIHSCEDVDKDEYVGVYDLDPIAKSAETLLRTAKTGVTAKEVDSDQSSQRTCVEVSA